MTIRHTGHEHAHGRGTASAKGLAPDYTLPRPQQTCLLLARAYQLRPACHEAQRAHAAPACPPQCSLGIRGRRPCGTAAQPRSSTDASLHPRRASCRRCCRLRRAPRRQTLTCCTARARLRTRMRPSPIFAQDRSRYARTGARAALRLPSFAAHTRHYLVRGFCFSLAGRFSLPVRGTLRHGSTHSRARARTTDDERSDVRPAGVTDWNTSGEGNAERKLIT